MCGLGKTVSLALDFNFASQSERFVCRFDDPAWGNFIKKTMN